MGRLTELSAGFGLGGMAMGASKRMLRAPHLGGTRSEAPPASGAFVPDRFQRD